ncbi:MAG: zinc finger Ran-binding domain-containing protein [Pyrinomonadaceae bacterium]
MSSWKCEQCGLTNFASAEQCKRCGEVPFGRRAAGDLGDAESGGRRTFGRRVLWIGGMVGVILAICYASLLMTSEPVTWEQQEKVNRAITHLESKGFSREVFVLRRLANYRTTDNWWNVQVGHENAYAATNFPFEVVTLYPEFFQEAQDDIERAVILLHESYHLRWADEPAALESTWRNKARVGWAEDQYGGTKLWRNTKELTMRRVPELFRCGLEQNEDCAAQQ